MHHRFRRPLRLAALLPLALAAACSDASINPLAVEGPAPAAVSSAAFADPFNTLDPARWTAESHPLGRGWLDAVNVAVAGGLAALTLPAGGYDGAEIRSAGRFRYGSFEARLRVPRADGSVSAWFLYQGVPGSANDEIDIEIFNDGTRRIMFTTWVQGRETNNVILPLPFDPSEAFHDYRIEWSSKRVRFLVDGVLMQQFTRGVPRNEMHLYANAWWPTWLTGPVLAEPRALEIDAARVF